VVDIADVFNLFLGIDFSCAVDSTAAKKSLKNASKKSEMLRLDYFSTIKWPLYRGCWSRP